MLLHAQKYKNIDEKSTTKRAIFAKWKISFDGFFSTHDKDCEINWREMDAVGAFSVASFHVTGAHPLPFLSFPFSPLEFFHFPTSSKMAMIVCEREKLAVGGMRVKLIQKIGKIYNFKVICMWSTVINATGDEGDFPLMFNFKLDPLKTNSTLVWMKWDWNIQGGKFKIVELFLSLFPAISIIPNLRLPGFCFYGDGFASKCTDAHRKSILNPCVSIMLCRESIFTSIVQMKARWCW